MTATTSSNEDNRISALLASGQVDLEITTSRAIGTHVLWHPLVTDDLYLALPQGGAAQESRFGSSGVETTGSCCCAPRLACGGWRWSCWALPESIPT